MVHLLSRLPNTAVKWQAWVPSFQGNHDGSTSPTNQTWTQAPVVPMQAQACAWLGHWYNEVAQEYVKARNCYRQALALEPSSTVLGEACILQFPPLSQENPYTMMWNGASRCNGCLPST